MGIYWYYPQPVHLPCLPMQHHAHEERAHLCSQGSFLLWSCDASFQRLHVSVRHPAPQAGLSGILGRTMAHQDRCYHQSLVLTCTLCRPGPSHTWTTTWAPGTGTNLSPPRKHPTAQAPLTPGGGRAPPPPPALSGPAGLAPAPRLRAVLIGPDAGLPSKEKWGRDQRGHGWWPPAPQDGARVALPQRECPSTRHAASCWNASHFL